MDKCFYKVRPKYHYTPQTGYMNDPNGLVYDADGGIYHLYYQYQEDVMPVGCTVRWGHAVSNDLLVWKEHSPVILPDKYGIIASGSSVVDTQNSSGLFDENKPKNMRFVAFYASVDMESHRQAIAMAYSVDGFNYTKYNGGKPILNNNDETRFDDFRDAKVVKYKNGWLMIVGGGQLKLFYSENLIDWHFQSAVENVKSEDASIDKDLELLSKYLPYNGPYNAVMPGECPDLFPLALNGEIKWVLLAGGIFYVVGDIIEVCGTLNFKPCTGKKRFYYSNDFFAHCCEGYASQSFYNDRFNRRVVLSWLMDNTASEKTGKPFNGVMSLPVMIKLEKRGEDYGLVTEWLPELYNAFEETSESTFDNALLIDAQWTLDSKIELEISSSENVMQLISDGGELELVVNGKERMRFVLEAENNISLMIDGLVTSLILNNRIQYSTFIFIDEKRYHIKKSNGFTKIILHRERT